jgi:hypothetical protein
MGFEKIRKSAPLSEWLFGLVIVLAIFFGTFSWFSYNIGDTGQTMDSRYNTLNNTLAESQADLDSNIEGIRNSAGNATEPDAGIFAVAINGMKGLSYTFQLFFTSITTFSKTGTAFTEAAADVIPTWAKALFFLGLIVLIVILIVSIFAGNSGNISK